MLPEVQYTISQKNQCEAIHLGICHVAFLLLPGTYNVFFLNTSLNRGQSQPGTGTAVAVRVSPVAGPGAFYSCWLFPLQNQVLALKCVVSAP